jgi:hypothetical protein
MQQACITISTLSLSCSEISTEGSEQHGAVGVSSGQFRMQGWLRGSFSELPNDLWTVYKEWSGMRCARLRRSAVRPVGAWRAFTALRELPARLVACHIGWQGCKVTAAPPKLRTPLPSGHWFPTNSPHTPPNQSQTVLSANWVHQNVAPTPIHQQTAHPCRRRLHPPAAPPLHR